MSKTTKRPKGGSLGTSKEGSESRPLSPSRGGPRRIEDLGMAALNWLSSELGLPIAEVIATLEANPSLLESAGRVAKTQASSAASDQGLKPKPTPAASDLKKPAPVAGGWSCRHSSSMRHVIACEI